MHSQWYQIPHPLGRQPTNWKIIMLQKFPHWSESSEPHIRLSSLREWKEELPPPPQPKNLALKDSGVRSQELHRTWGKTNSTFWGWIQSLMPTNIQRKKSSDPMRVWDRLTCWYWRVSCRGGGSCGSLQRQGHWWQGRWGVLIGISCPGGHHFFFLILFYF